MCPHHFQGGVGWGFGGGFLVLCLPLFLFLDHVSDLFDLLFFIGKLSFQFTLLLQQSVGLLLLDAVTPPEVRVHLHNLVQLALKLS